MRPRAGPAVAWGSFVVLACSTTIKTAETETLVFYGAVSADVEEAVHGLGAPGLDALEDALPGLDGVETWQAVLDALADRSRLEPLAEAARTSIERHVDPAMRVQILAPGGNRRLRDLLVSTMRNALAERRAP